MSLNGVFGFQNDAFASKAWIGPGTATLRPKPEFPMLVALILTLAVFSIMLVLVDGEPD